ncbi:DUF3095 domain-containing protein [Thiomicrospira microaerophila]|uniref:DUF3095 domain-containing protein n=1 Tax=Thiomicrospira microaerophila TaxID=406020 RepID=UPI0005C8BF45|nr:DUF3095 domain-containing protein [Thiomicrospira microaerophila]
MTHSNDFYQTLPKVQQFDQILVEQNFSELPADWLVVITDVINSTKAIEQGDYRSINAVGGFTVAAMVNTLKPLAFPYVFGGDGATFCIPPRYRDAVTTALQACQQLAKNSFNLDLRIGLIAYRELTSKIFVAHYQKNASLDQAVFMGGGLSEADDKIKYNDRYHIPKATKTVEADFSGFECRWKRLPSPHEITVSLLVKAHGDLSEQMRRLKSLQQQINQTLGDEKDYHPLAVTHLQLGFSAQTLMGEMLVKSAGRRSMITRLKYLWIIRLQNLLGLVLMRFGIKIGEAHWGHYKQDFLHNADYRKVDDVYRTVLSCDKAQWQQLEYWLTAQGPNELIYGAHTSDAALVTCLISKAGVQHLHFVDGADGGYALAAKQLKSRLHANNPR